MADRAKWRTARAYDASVTAGDRRDSARRECLAA
jgi:hypothetical protein